MRVMNALNAAVARGLGANAQRKKEQDFTTCLDFWTDRTWNVLLDKSAAEVAKRDAICNAMLGLKCVNPSPHTLSSC